MNRITLNFIDSNYEKNYRIERFKMDKYIILQLLIAIFTIGMFLSITNYFSDNVQAGTILLCVTFASTLCYRLALGNSKHLDAINILVQLALNTAYPLMIQYDIQYGISDNEGPKQFQRATLVAYITFSILVGSKYYIQALGFIYSLILQLALFYYYYSEFVVQEGILLIIVSLTVVYRCYLNEYSFRMYFLQKQQLILFNQNVMNSQHIPFMQCTLDHDILTMKYHNELVEQDLKIINQGTFTKFVRNLHIQNMEVKTLELYLYGIFMNEQHQCRNQCIRLVGLLDNVKYICYLSFYLSDSKEMLLINCQRLLERNLEHQLQSKVRSYQTIIRAIQKLTYQLIEKCINRDHFMLVSNCKQFIIDFHSLLIHQISTEPISLIRLTDIIGFVKYQFSTQTALMKFQIAEDCKQIQSMRYHIYLFYANLVLAAYDSAKEQSHIVIMISQTKAKHIDADLLVIELHYLGHSLQPNRMQILHDILQRVGIGRIKEHIRHQCMFKYKMKLIQQLENTSML